MGAPKLDQNTASNLPTPVKSENTALFRLDMQRTELGKGDSLRYNILSWVLDESYDRAISGLREFLEQESPYPNFQDKISRYVNHSIDLIYAIKAKRNFPGINSLTRAKQQELREKFKEHFKELQYILVRIEKVETDLRINDARSTMYVVKALWMAGLAIVILAFVLEAYHGLAVTTQTVTNEFADDAIGWVFNKLGL